MYMKASELYILAEQEEYAEQAKTLAQHLNAEYMMQKQDVSNEKLILNWKKEGLTLECGNLSMRGDFSTMIPRIRNEKWKHEMLVKAAKLKKWEEPMWAIDATAGMGEDSMLLAAAGYQVSLYEYNPIIAALLKDALERAKKDTHLSEIVDRMHFHEGDSISAMKARKEPVDLIYLDPMFPARQKSGLIKKKFQLLQKMESPCMEERALLEAAFAVSPKRIVIKRPAKGPFMAERKPDFSFQGKAIRYDCFSFL